MQKTFLTFLLVWTNSIAIGAFVASVDLSLHKLSATQKSVGSGAEALSPFLLPRARLLYNVPVYGAFQVNGCAVGGFVRYEVSSTDPLDNPNELVWGAEIGPALMFSPIQFGVRAGIEQRLGLFRTNELLRLEGVAVPYLGPTLSLKISSWVIEMSAHYNFAASNGVYQLQSGWSYLGRIGWEIFKAEAPVLLSVFAERTSLNRDDFDQFSLRVGFGLRTTFSETE